jgi:hypothetical protein
MKVAICTPIRDGKVHYSYAASFAITVASAPQGCEMQWFTLAGQANVPRVRNYLAAKAMGWGADHIWLIDDDIGWEAPDFWRMTAESKPFLVGVIQARAGDRLDEPPRLGANFIGNKAPEIDPETGLCEIVEGATAFMRLRRVVFERLAETAEAFEPDYKLLSDEEKAWCREYFHYGIDNGRSPGEDYHFCRDWRRTGGRIWADPKVRLQHWDGRFCFNASLGDFINAAQREKAA